MVSCQVGRTGMDTGADAEVLNLLELPETAPDLWQLMSKPESNGIVHPNKPDMIASDTIHADARVPVVSS